MNDFSTRRQEFYEERGVPVGTLPVKRLSEGAKLPVYGSGAAAGLDLHADMYEMSSLVDDYKSASIIIEPGRRALIKTGISVKIPKGNYGRIAPRSGLAYKYGIDVLAGVIDEDYRGDVGVILINFGEDPFKVTHGDRIAQMVITPYLPSLVVDVASLDETNRGTGGWGSTGV